jgi:nucleoside-diphosphate-sugar epimerase
VLDVTSLHEAFQDVTAVIHAAGFVSFNPRQRKNIYEVNVAGTRNVVDTCLHLGIPQLVHISSVAALGRKSGELLTEENKWTGAPATDYAESKYLAELEVFRGGEEGLSVSLVNPSVILSAAQSRSSSALFDYVWNEKPFYTKGMLNYVDARDVADAVFTLIRNPQAGEKFILNAGEIPYKDFFERLALAFDKRAPFWPISRRLSYWAGWAEELRARLAHQEPLVTRQSAKMSVQSYRYDAGKANKLLRLSFRTLEESVDWCCADYMRNVKANK